MRRVGRAQEPVAHRADQVEDRVGVGDLLPRRGQPADRVEDPAQERQRQDDDAVDEHVVVEGLGVDADDHAEGREQHQRERHRQDQHPGLVDGHVDDDQREHEQGHADGQRAHRAAERQAQVDLPGAHGRREDVVQVAVEPGLEHRRGVVRVGGLDHRHRDQPGHDEHVVGEAVDLLDAPAQRQPEHEDEQERRDHRRDDGLRPQLEHPQDLAAREPEERAVAAVVITWPSPSGRRR